MPGVKAKLVLGVPEIASLKLAHLPSVLEELETVKTQNCILKSLAVLIFKYNFLLPKSFFYFEW